LLHLTAACVHSLDCELQIVNHKRYKHVENAEGTIQAGGTSIINYNDLVLHDRSLSIVACSFGVLLRSRTQTRRWPSSAAFPSQHRARFHSRRCKLFGQAFGILQVIFDASAGLLDELLSCNLTELLSSSSSLSYPISFIRLRTCWSALEQTMHVGILKRPHW
jgi:hypothetical protein